jgi:FKBP-type peptidyl-prolyl cis-trans isomerase SlyD
MFTDIMKFWLHKELEGKSAGDVIEVPIDGNQIFGHRDESLVFTDHIENVPEEYRQVGISILMENEKGLTRSFIVTRMDDETLTIDGNNPLCGREVVFKLEILRVRGATDEETRTGQAIIADVGIDPSLMRPV